MAQPGRGSASRMRPQAGHIPAGHHCGLYAYRMTEPMPRALGDGEIQTPVSCVPMLFKFADNRDPASYLSRLRLRRNQWFASLIADLPRPLSILDVGGTEKVWETVGLAGDPTVRVTLVNIQSVQTTHSNIQSVLADARDLRQFADGHFDVIYSNSLIEHVGSFKDMKRMANEVRRVSKQ